MTFAELGLSSALLSAIDQLGYHTPSPIQTQAIPPILAGKDILAAAQTGTGKTAGFALPILHRLSNHNKKASPKNQARALILTPTRELAAQVGDNIVQFSQHLPLRCQVVFGGVKINPQMQRLRGGVDILVATPGRLLDLHQQNAIHFDQLEVLVLDEADRMLDMGFIHDIRKILALLPPRRQNLLFSATFSDNIRALAKGLVKDAVEVSVSPKNTTAKTVTQWLVPVDKSKKPALLIHLIKHHNWQQVLVFSRTKHGANRLAEKLNKAGLSAAAIHGNKSQGARTRALADFKSGDVRILVATDIAARGLDIDQLPQVINVDLPNVAEDYVHRIGRTGRAGASGEAISLVSADEFPLLQDIERLTQQLIRREFIDDFIPDHHVPESKLLPPKKIKRPKKTKPVTTPTANPSRQRKPTNRSQKQSTTGHNPPSRSRRQRNKSS